MRRRWRSWREVRPSRYLLHAMRCSLLLFAVAVRCSRCAIVTITAILKTVIPAKAGTHTTQAVLNMLRSRAANQMVHFCGSVAHRTGCCTRVMGPGFRRGDGFEGAVNVTRQNPKPYDAFLRLRCSSNGLLHVRYGPGLRRGDGNITQQRSKPYDASLRLRRLSIRVLHRGYGSRLSPG
jgi:hypothetical protein